MNLKKFQLFLLMVGLGIKPLLSQTLEVNDTVAYEGQDLVFEIKLLKATQSFVVDCNVENITTSTGDTSRPKRSFFLKKKGADFDDKMKAFRLNKKDYYSSNQVVAFSGKKGEKQYVTIRTRADRWLKEDDEKLRLILYKNEAPIDTAIGVIKNVVCRSCPPEKFLDSHKDNAFRLNFFGDGNIQSTVSDGAEIPANTGLGISAIKYFPDLPHNRFLLWYRIDLAATINVASNVDTLFAQLDPTTKNAINDHEFGNSILTPLNSGEAVNLVLTMYNKKTFLGLISGVEMKYVGSNRVWHIDTNSYRVNTNMFRIGIFHDFVPYDKRDDFSARIKFGSAGNWLNGDIFDRDSQQLKRFIGVNSPNFSGFETGIDFRLKNIIAEFSYTTLYGKNGDVRGLTDGRIVTTIRFIGGFGLNLDKQNK